jgi:hypothetical protein
VFLDYPAEGDKWKPLWDNSYVNAEDSDDDKIKFKDDEIRAKYQDYFYMIQTVPDHGYSKE